MKKTNDITARRPTTKMARILALLLTLLLVVAAPSMTVFAEGLDQDSTTTLGISGEETENGEISQFSSFPSGNAKYFMDYIGDPEIYLNVGDTYVDQGIRITDMVTGQEIAIVYEPYLIYQEIGGTPQDTSAITSFNGRTMSEECKWELDYDYVDSNGDFAVDRNSYDPVLGQIANITRVIHVGTATQNVTEVTFDKGIYRVGETAKITFFSVAQLSNVDVTVRGIPVQVVETTDLTTGKFIYTASILLDQTMPEGELYFEVNYEAAGVKGNPITWAAKPAFLDKGTLVRATFSKAFFGQNEQVEAVIESYSTLDNLKVEINGYPAEVSQVMTRSMNIKYLAKLAPGTIKQSGPLTISISYSIGGVQGTTVTTATNASTIGTTGGTGGTTGGTTSSGGSGGSGTGGRNTADTSPNLPKPAAGTKVETVKPAEEVKPPVVIVPERELNEEAPAPNMGGDGSGTKVDNVDDNNPSTGGDAESYLAFCKEHDLAIDWDFYNSMNA